MRTIFKYITLIASSAVLFSSCEKFLPETKVDTDVVKELADLNYSNLLAQGIEVYNHLPKGFARIDNAMLAAATDEADYAISGSSIEKYQLGTWNALSQPDNNWNSIYQGIRRSNIFMDASKDFEKTIVRDTFTVNGKTTYREQVTDLKYLRAENKAMVAYLYFELLKRFGGVPIVEQVYGLDDDAKIIRSSYDEVVDYIVSTIDDALPELIDSWQEYKSANYGRLEKAGAMAIKSRVLLYAASPAYNLTGDLDKWKKAADAAKAVIDLKRFRLAGDYGTMFLGLNGHQNPEAILSYMTGSTNTMEVLNYPVSTNGASSGTCPSANLVDAYEFADGTEFSWSKVAAGQDPYANRDPRLQQTVVVNGSTWNGRTMEIYEGGKEGISVKNATTTGYYLKKFLTDNLDLELGQKAFHAWPLFRYAEILLNYAEAMNEAYGPDVDYYGGGKTARWAINQIRVRSNMPDVVANSQAEMRQRIMHERQIELAFEEHRFWDVRRWGVDAAKTALAAPLKGVKAVKNGNSFSYSTFTVESRVFEDHMIYFPIPQNEILYSNGLIAQNPGW